MIGVATFTNSGVIDLQSNPAAGDVLLITGGREAGVAGPGTFISNGGSLKLDTVLNEGGAATHSDTLVVDGTWVGPDGATQTFIRNAGGGGALTVGDGILVVQVLDPTRSAAGAFALAVRSARRRLRLFSVSRRRQRQQPRRLVSSLRLRRGTSGRASGRAAGRRSYRRRRRPNPLPPGVAFPIIGPELATYGVVQPLARQLGLAHPRHARRSGRRHLRAGARLRAVAPAICRPGSRADQEIGADACALPGLLAVVVGPLLRPNDRQPLSRLRRSTRQRQSGRLPGRHRSSARFAITHT